MLIIKVTIIFETPWQLHSIPTPLIQMKSASSRCVWNLGWNQLENRIRSGMNVPVMSLQWTAQDHRPPTRCEPHLLSQMAGFPGWAGRDRSSPHRHKPSTVVTPCTINILPRTQPVASAPLPERSLLNSVICCVRQSLSTTLLTLFHHNNYQYLTSSEPWPVWLSR